MSKLMYPKYRMKNSTKYSTRSSQSVLQFGSGAMVDFPDQTLMTAAPDIWAESVTEINDERLQKALGVKFFGMPGTNSTDADTRLGISYVRFPEWYFCPVCRRFKRLKDWAKDYLKYASEKAKSNDPHMMERPRCYKCHCDLVAGALVNICENGHISDFPWTEWAHIKSIPSKEICNDPQIYFRTGTSVSEGLQGLIVSCENCKARATLRDAFRPDVFRELMDMGRVEFKCKGRHPWKGSKTNCGKPPITKQRGDTSVYFPCSVSSIVIPTNADENTNRVLECNRYKKILTSLEEYDEEDERIDFIENRLEKWTKQISELLLMKSTTVKKILKQQLLNSENEATDNTTTLDSIKYKYEEFNALSGLTEQTILGSEDFLREEMDIERYDIPGVEKIVLVKKLREVRALVGFSRLKPLTISNMEDEAFVHIKSKEADWYPGYEVRGEGIFIQFKLEQLNNWAKTRFAIHRQEILTDNYKLSMLSNSNGEEPEAEYILLHTIAHVLLKQLSFECGYNIASLRERIYYSQKIDDNSGMAGILIYTASGDSEGTLGGLVRQGRSDCFPRIFKEAVEKTRMCSNDPVCITSGGQGRESLNLAACHSCGLIPETSCERFNILLDRALIVGTFENPDAGFYSTWEERFTQVPEECLVPTEESVDISAEEPQPTRVSVRQRSYINVCDDGVLQSGSYTDVWDNILADAEEDADIALFEELKEISDGNYEMPIYDGSVNVEETHIAVDLIWKSSKVLFFLSDREDEYNIAKNKGWKCYCQAVDMIDPHKLLKDIEVN